MTKKFISVTSHALYPPPPVTNCHTFSDPLPSSMTYFMDGPLTVLGWDKHPLYNVHDTGGTKRT